MQLAVMHPVEQVLLVEIAQQLADQLQVVLVEKVEVSVLQTQLMRLHYARQVTQAMAATLTVAQVLQVELQEVAVVPMVAQVLPVGVAATYSAEQAAMVVMQPAALEEIAATLHST